MSTDPDRIREEIRSTRASLSDDVDALAYKASPTRMVHERTDRVRHGVRRMRDTVMGTVADVGDRAGDAASTVGDTAGSAAGQVKRAAQGNPLAAGLVVFGAAWLASSLLPGSRGEAQAAQRAMSMAQEHAGPVKEALADSAREIRDDLREPVREAADSVRETVTGAAQETGRQSAEAAREVAGQAQEAVRSR
jgi:hypothetical protein